MTRVAGIDGAPGQNWAVVIADLGCLSIHKLAECDLSDFLSAGNFKIVAMDVPIGLLDSYNKGGRTCDQEARKILGARRNSVFSAPIRPVLNAKTHKEASDRSRASAPGGKGITIQAFDILPKVRQVDDLLRERPELRKVVREVHPEVCLRELAGGKPMCHHKSTQAGKNERRDALATEFPKLDHAIEKSRRELRLNIEDIMDATVACWSARRLAAGEGRSIPAPFQRDSTWLPMAIWV